MINLDFAVAAAKSAADPDNPASPVNITTKPFYLNTATVDPQKSFNPMSDFTFAHSFNGNEQPVQVLARDLNNDGVVDATDDVKLHYTIDGVLATPAGGLPTTEWPGGDRYGETGDVYYHVVGGTVTGAPADSDAGVVYRGREDEPVVHVPCREGGSQPGADPGGHGLHGPVELPGVRRGGRPAAIPVRLRGRRRGVRETYDVYDVDALGAAPDHLGVLGHYRRDLVHGERPALQGPGQPGGTGAETQANTMMLEVRPS